jgi:hypothetical protein
MIAWWKQKRIYRPQGFVRARSPGALHPTREQSHRRDVEGSMAAQPPARTDVVLESRSVDRGELLVPVNIEFQLALAPPPGSPGVDADYCTDEHSGRTTGLQDCIVSANRAAVFSSEVSVKPPHLVRDLISPEYSPPDRRAELLVRPDGSAFGEGMRLWCFTSPCGVTCPGSAKPEDPVEASGS